MADGQTVIRLLLSFGKRPVALLGEAILDRYLKGHAVGICREAPVPVVGLQEVHEAPGGAANVAANMAALGGRVRFVSAVGEDGYGERLRTLLTAQGVNTQGVLPVPGRRTLVKHRLRCDDQLVARFDEGDGGPIDRKSEQALAQALMVAAEDSACIVISDYDLGLIGPTLQATLKTLRAAGHVLIVDAKRPARYRDLHPDLVKPNFAEAAGLLAARDPGGDRVVFVRGAEGALLAATGARSVVVTLDRDGALLLGPEGPYRTSGRAVPAAYAAGAGDTFLSVLALGLAHGGPLPAVMDLAAAATDLILEHDGTVRCGQEELIRELAGQGKLLRDAAQIGRAVAQARTAGRRIVFTNGCFDILHRGHITYLERAKALGDVLIVGLNDDASVRRLKGPDRPVNGLADRIAVVAALGCVDHVLAFAGDTAHEPIARVQPDIFVKGGDYAAKALPEAPLVEDLGGRVRILEYVDNNSTSGLIERIRRDLKTG